MAFFIISCLPLLKFNIAPFYSIRLCILSLLIFLLLIIILKEFYNSKYHFFNTTFIDVLYILYILFTFISYLQTENRAVAHLYMSKEIILFCFYCYIRYLLQCERKKNWIILFIIISLTFLTIWGLLQYTISFDVEPALANMFKTYHNPVIASLGNPNFFSEFLVLAFPALFLIIKKNYYIFSGLLILHGFAVYITFSRLAWFVYVISILIIFVYLSNTLKKNILLPLSILALLAATHFIYHHHQSSTKTNRILKSTNISVFKERKIIYTTAMHMFAQSSIFGKGPGSFELDYLKNQGKIAMQIFENPKVHTYVDLDHAHSDFLEIAYDIGYVGLFFYLVLLIYALYRGLSQYTY